MLERRCKDSTPGSIIVYARFQKIVSNPNFFISELQNFKCLRFYTTFQLEILNSTLKLNIFSTFTHVMLQKWLKLSEIINSNTPLLEFSTIFVMEKVKDLFLQKSNYFIFKLTYHIIFKLTCTSCRSYQQTSQIFPSITQSISTKLHM